MQTFLPYPDFKRSAQVLDNMRLGKQRVETFQIAQQLVGQRLMASVWTDTGRTRTVWLDERRRKVKPDLEATLEELAMVGVTPLEEPILKRSDLPVEQWRVEPVGRGWGNHPMTRMWRGHLATLLEYQKAVCDEWTQVRGYKDTCLLKTTKLVEMSDPKFMAESTVPEWLGRPDLHLSHRSNLIRKDADRYADFFEPGLTDELPYVWPVDK